MIRLLIDAIAFQRGMPPAASRWGELLRILNADARLEVTLLDRGQAPALQRGRSIPFARARPENRAADSSHIQWVCNDLDIDVFVSTGDTSPLSTPMLALVDQVPGLSQSASGASPACDEHAIAIAYAQRYLCSDESVQRDLLRLHPGIAPSHVHAVCLGVDHGLFRPPTEEAAAAFLERHALEQPYLLVHDSGTALAQDARDLRRAIAHLGVAVGLPVACIGGGADGGVAAQLAGEGSARRIRIGAPEELALAYGAALAMLAWPPADALCAPAFDAMATGCPVLALRAGTAADCDGPAINVDAPQAEGAEAFARGLASVVQALAGDGTLRDQWRRRSVAHAAGLSWQDYAESLTSDLLRLDAETRRGDYAVFFAEWSRLRRMQAAVDFPPLG